MCCVVCVGRGRVSDVNSCAGVDAGCLALVEARAREEGKGNNDAPPLGCLSCGGSAAAATAAPAGSGGLCVCRKDERNNTTTGEVKSVSHSSKPPHDWWADPPSAHDALVTPP